MDVSARCGRRGLMLLLVSALALSAAPAQAGKSKIRDGKEAKATKATRLAKQPKPTKSALSGPESRAERDKRLLRECQGRPNAGACEGYANARR